VEVEVIPWVAMVAGVGFIGGLALLVRGMAATGCVVRRHVDLGSFHRRRRVRLTGSSNRPSWCSCRSSERACVYYRATIREDNDDLGDTEAIGRVPSATRRGVRVFRAMPVDAPIGSTGERSLATSRQGS
jgi:hypothetical protein